MRFLSTRGIAPAATLAEAIRNGAAPDGGLYMPEEVPQPDLASLTGDLPLPEFAAAMLRPFFAGDRLEGELAAIAAEAFTFPAPVVTPDPASPRFRALELFHGPTGAFKDFGARFLMACFDRLADPAEPLTVLAATSGDTGGAVGAAAEGREAVRAVILFPKGRVSKFQKLQLTCWDDPVRAVEVEGDFDDCQRLVKAAFADPDLSRRYRLTSANSINVGRLMPQMAYIGWAATKLFEETGEKSGFIIPTGNLGHGFAAVYARAMGLPIGPIDFVTNANRTLSRWHSNGTYEAAASIATIANAMDVGAPSNFERLNALSSDLRDVRVDWVDDDAIRDRVRAEYAASGYVWCPHSATAVEVYRRMDESRRSERTWVAAATAHPFKFADEIEPLIGRDIEAPGSLAGIFGRQQRKAAIPVRLDALVETLESERTRAFETSLQSM